MAIWGEQGHASLKTTTSFFSVEVTEKQGSKERPTRANSWEDDKETGESMNFIIRPAQIPPDRPPNLDARTSWQELSSCFNKIVVFASLHLCVFVSPGQPRVFLSQLGYKPNSLNRTISFPSPWQVRGVLTLEGGTNSQNDVHQVCILLSSSSGSLLFPSSSDQSGLAEIDVVMCATAVSYVSFQKHLYSEPGKLNLSKEESQGFL